MGEGERSRAETQAHNISRRQKENSGGAAGAVGEVEGAAEKGYIEPAGAIYWFRCSKSSLEQYGSEYKRSVRQRPVD